MADQPVRRRRRHPFSLWFPSWSSPSRASQRPRQQPEEKPPPITSQSPDPRPPTTEATGTQLDGDPTLPTPSKPSAGDELQGLNNGGEVLTQLSAMVEAISPQQEEKPSQAYMEMDSEPLQNSAAKPEEEEDVITRQSDQVRSFSAEINGEPEAIEHISEPKSIEPISEPKAIEPISEPKAIEPQFQRSEAQPEQNEEPEAEEDDASPAKISATEESNSKEEELKRVEKPEEIEEPAKISEPKLSTEVSDSKPTPERQVSAGKERKITISTKPRALASNLGQATALVQKLSIGNQSMHGVNIITLASENKGASMIINGCIKKGKKSGKEAPFHNERSPNQSSIAASINSNVQGINSSILDETNYGERSPGVHLTIFSKPTATQSKLGKTEAAAAQKVASSSAPPEKVTYDPGVRRKCLRSFLLESSEDESSQKPRRHGCRFSCDDKTKEQKKKDFF